MLKRIGRNILVLGFFSLCAASSLFGLPADENLVFEPIPFSGNQSFGDSDGNFGEVELGTGGVAKGWFIKNKSGVELRIISVDGIGAFPFGRGLNTAVRNCAPSMKLAAAGGVCQIRVRANTKQAGEWGLDPLNPREIVVVVQVNKGTARHTVRIPLKIKVKVKTGFVKLLGGSDYHLLKSTSIDSSGNFILSGHTIGSFEGEQNKGSMDAFIVKLNAGGNIIWKKQLGGSGYDYAISTSIDSSGNVLLVGRTDGSFEGEQNKGGYDAFIVKLDSIGNIIWKKQLGGSGFDYPISTSIDSSGNVFLAGTTYGSFEGEQHKGRNDAFIVKLNASGNIVWKKSLGGSGGDGTVSTSVDSSGNVFLTGFTTEDFEGEQYKGSFDAFIVKLDSNGNIIWKKLLGGSGSDTPVSTSIDSSGNVYLGGYTSHSFEGEQNHREGRYDVFIAKLNNENGNIEWKKQLGGIGNDYLVSTSIDSSGNIFLIGNSTYSGITEESFEGKRNKGLSDVFIAKLNSINGDIVWIKQIGGNQGDIPTSTSIDSSGNIFIAGHTRSSFEGYQHRDGDNKAFITKLNNANGNMELEKQFGKIGYVGGANEVFTSVDSSGNIFLSGTADGSFEGEQNKYSDAFIIKLITKLP